METVVAYDGVKLSGRLKTDRRFELFIENVPTNSVLATSANPKTRNLGFHEDPSAVNIIIKDIILVIDGKNIEIPKNTYEDLWNVILPRGVYLMESGPHALIYLEGGDGESSYTARLIIEGDRVLRRETIGGGTSWNNAETIKF